MLLGNAVTAGKLALDFVSYARHPYTLERSIQLLQAGIARREPNFLGWIRQHAYGNPRSPYVQLLRAAGVELGDIEKLVRSEGLEGALQELLRLGVYLSYEEFKGRVDVVRGSQTFHFQETDFDNPAVRALYARISSGSSGARVSSPADIRLIAYQNASLTVAYTGYGLHRPLSVLWKNGPPDSDGLTFLLSQAAMDMPLAERWFTPTAPQGGALPLGQRVGLRVLGRLIGQRFPEPELLDLAQAEAITTWIRDARRRGTVLVRSSVSPGMMVAAAADRQGMDLSGVVFLVGGEAVTPARGAALTRLGSRLLQLYSTSEQGRLAISCPNAPLAETLHLLSDKVALITHERQYSGLTVRPFVLTSLYPLAPKLFLNVETDDTGVIESSHCGCPLEGVGYKTLLSDIRSFGKLTAQGRNVMGADMARILEEVLPPRFGGSPVDYQVVETEDADGAPRLILRINPAVGPVDDRLVVQTLLEQLRRVRHSYSVTADLWRQAETIAVERKLPIASASGKVLALYFAPMTTRTEDPV